jgi:hypothetical protein
MTIASNALISEADYCAIEDALQSTEKGRRFLRAYTGRNRSLESRRLLRSISRLHRAALGAPGMNAEVCRDLASVLRSVSRHRQRAADCSDAAERSIMLAGGLEEAEACLIALIESIEERTFETLNEGCHFETFDDPHPGAKPEKLFGELSAFFSGEPR